jgi:hypothetical protein
MPAGTSLGANRMNDRFFLDAYIFVYSFDQIAAAHPTLGPIATVCAELPDSAS